MARVTLFWLTVALVCVVTALPRADARSAQLEASGQAILLDRVRSALVRNGIDGSDDILDDGVPVGVDFWMANCAAPVRVVAMHLSSEAQSVLEDWIRPGDLTTFRFHGIAHGGEARLHPLATYAADVFLTAMGQRDGPAIKHQLGLVTPQGCPLPELDWSALWQPDDAR